MIKFRIWKKSTSRYNCLSCWPTTKSIILEVPIINFTQNNKINYKKADVILGAEPTGHYSYKQHTYPNEMLLTLLYS